MKKAIIMALAVGLTMTACEKAIEVPDGEASGVVEEPAKTKKFTFTMKGDFSDDWKTTRGYLAADGRDMTDVWVLDYMNGELVQQLHQGDNTAEDFGKPVMQLAYGSHHVYFVASRGTTPTLNVGTHSIVWERPSDTFWKALSLTVGSGTASTVAVALDRVVTKLRIAVADEVPATIATLEMVPGQWWYGIDYLTGEAVSTSAEVRSVTVPASMAGTTGQLVAGFYCLSDNAEWMTDVTIRAKDGDGAVIGSVSLADVPFVRNRVTDASGNLFASLSGFSISLNEQWLDSYTLEW